MESGLFFTYVLKIMMADNGKDLIQTMVDIREDKDKVTPNQGDKLFNIFANQVCKLGDKIGPI